MKKLRNLHHYKDIFDLMLQRVLPFTILGLVIFTTLWTFSNSTVKEYANFKLSHQPKFIALGHSHTANALNDSLIGDFQNLAYPGEPYFYSYIKLREILKQNKSIQIVFLEFTNNQISNRMDEWTLEKKYMLNFFIEYVPFMNHQEYIYLLKHNAESVLSASIHALIQNFVKIYTQDYNYTEKLGGYIARNTVVTIDTNFLNTLRKENLSKEKGEQYYSKHNLYFLRKIQEHCQAKGIKLLLIRSPQYPSYVIQTEEQFQKIRTSHFSSLPFLDFNSFSLADTCFADYDHLNQKGASIFSAHFSQLLKENFASVIPND